jgi:dCTP deaminase
VTLLSDRDLLLALNSGEILLDPYIPENVQPSSIDVRLGPDFKFLDHDGDINPFEPVTYSTYHNVGALNLRPGQFVLAHTVEKLTLPSNIAARLEGKSTLGRMGLLTHATAGFIDPGFSGQITLELCVLAPNALRLVPGMLIGQLCFFRMSSTVTNPYGSSVIRSHYQNQTGPTAPAELNEQLTLW